jgi:fatty acid desaturase
MDPTSTYRFGHNGEQEGMFSYCAHSLFRDSTNFAVKKAVSKGESLRLILETLVILCTIALWVWIDWQWALFVLLPLFLFGWFLAHLENYYEHFHAPNPDNKFTNSVSYYGAIYNKLMFNEGYHQEHHLRPGKHWKDRPSINEQYKDKMKTEGSFAARFPPLFGFLDKE